MTMRFDVADLQLFLGVVEQGAPAAALHGLLPSTE